MRQFQADDVTLRALLHSAARRHTHAGHAPMASSGISRRGFIGGAAGAAGAVVGLGLLNPVAALAKKPFDATPTPTKTTTSIGGVDFHFSSFGPGNDPTSITDFNGFVGVADVQGTGTASYPDGSSETLLFDTDMRFMKGVYVGQDGAVHKGAFGFVWLDLYRGQYDFTNFSTQVHDFDPGITPYPGGLFWTVPLTADALTVEFGAGRASMNVSNLALNDFFNIPNALFRFQDPVSMAAAVSFDIIWSGPITNSSSVDDPSKGFSGDFVLNQATMTWSASNALGLAFTSNPSGTTSAFAQLGHMQNGVFSGG